MPPFSQRHAPPPRQLGPTIPAGVRRAIDSWFRERRIDPQDVRRTWFQRAGYGNVDDVIADVRDRWGDGQGASLRRDLEANPSVDQWRDGNRRRLAATTVVHLLVPAPLYLDYVEVAVALYVEERRIVQEDYVEYIEDPYIAPVRYLNTLFERRRIDYRLREDGVVEWHGDEGAYYEVVRPALDALVEERLAGVRQEFEAALGHLRAGTDKDGEDAIEEAFKAVESAMKVLLAERGVERVGNETSEPLWNLLREAGIVPPKTKDAILSTSRLRNEYAGHGQGEDVRDIPAGIPELTVRDAAAAIAYLAALLP